MGDALFSTAAAQLLAGESRFRRGQACVVDLWQSDNMWVPRTEHEIQLAIDEGNLVENRFLDVKRWADAASDGARKETARDLSSFAIGGGALLFGVAEDKATREFSREPFNLAGAAEKIEQIAATRIDPPLTVVVTDIPSEDDPNLGYLFVEVPPSPHAPHMVDGRYHARADRTKRQLVDAEVIRMHQDRQRGADKIREALDAWVSREVVPTAERGNAHLRIVAVPMVQHRPDAFERVARGGGGAAARELVLKVERALHSSFERFEPSFVGARTWAVRESGGALTTLRAQDPILDPFGGESDLVDVEFHDDGSIRILMGRLTDFVPDGDAELKVMFEIGLISWVWRALHLVREVSAVMDYRGSWGFALHADGLDDSAGFAEQNGTRFFFGRDRYLYPLKSYTAMTEAHLVELERNGAVVVDRLVRKLLQGYRSYDRVTDLIRAQGSR